MEAPGMIETKAQSGAVKAVGAVAASPNVMSVGIEYVGAAYDTPSAQGRQRTIARLARRGCPNGQSLPRQKTN